jgi:tetratricopeptide (TPR) repeat protein
LSVAITLGPEFLPDALFQTGNLLLARRDPQRAAEQYQRATSLRPSFDQAWEKLGDTLLSIGQIERAIDSFRKLVQLRPRDQAANAKLQQALNARQRKPASR